MYTVGRNLTIKNMLEKKTIEIEINGKELVDLTSVLIDVLDYYSTILTDKGENLKKLVSATRMSNELTKKYYNEKQ